jgi:hypothetical protein
MRARILIRRALTVAAFAICGIVAWGASSAWAADVSCDATPTDNDIKQYIADHDGVGDTLDPTVTLGGTASDPCTYEFGTGANDTPITLVPGMTLDGAGVDRTIIDGIDKGDGNGVDSVCIDGSADGTTASPIGVEGLELKRCEVALDIGDNWEIGKNSSGSRGAVQIFNNRMGIVAGSANPSEDTVINDVEFDENDCQAFHGALRDTSAGPRAMLANSDFGLLDGDSVGDGDGTATNCDEVLGDPDNIAATKFIDGDFTSGGQQPLICGNDFRNAIGFTDATGLHGGHGLWVDEGLEDVSTDSGYLIVGNRAKGNANTGIRIEVSDGVTVGASGNVACAEQTIDASNFVNDNDGLAGAGVVVRLSSNVVVTENEIDHTGVSNGNRLLEVFWAARDLDKSVDSDAGDSDNDPSTPNAEDDCHPSSDPPLSDHCEVTTGNLIDDNSVNLSNSASKVAGFKILDGGAFSSAVFTGNDFVDNDYCDALANGTDHFKWVDADGNPAEVAAAWVPDGSEVDWNGSGTQPYDDDAGASFTTGTTCVNKGAFRVAS